MSGHKRPKFIIPVQRFLDSPTINSNEDSEDETSGGLPSGQKSPPPGWRRKVATLQPQLDETGFWENDDLASEIEAPQTFASSPNLYVQSQTNFGPILCLPLTNELHLRASSFEINHKDATSELPPQDLEEKQIEVVALQDIVPYLEAVHHQGTTAKIQTVTNENIEAQQDVEALPNLESDQLVRLGQTAAPDLQDPLISINEEESEGFLDTPFCEQPGSVESFANSLYLCMKDITKLKKKIKKLKRKILERDVIISELLSLV